MISTVIHSIGVIAISLFVAQSPIANFESKDPSPASKPRINWSTKPLTKAQEEKSIALNFRYESDDLKDFYIYNGYILKYSAKQRGAEWSTHYIPYKRVRDDVKPGLVRGNYDIPFKKDPNRANTAGQPDASEYVNTGFDKGHITPAGDFRNDSLGMLETFYMTNMTAQTPDFNQKVMLAMEDRVRAWVTNNHTDCQVITGAIYEAKNGRGFGKRGQQVKYPTAHYKIMYAEKNGESVLYCFLVPHQFGYGDFDIADYQVTLDEIEEHAKTDFLDKLDNSVEHAIESKLFDMEKF